MKEPHLLVNEVYGPAFQGEGPDAGKRCAFLRLAGCNLACSWCDTPYSWDWTRFDKHAEIHPMRFADVYASLITLGAHRVVVTGGEPLIQARKLEEFIRDAPEFSFEIETNGTIAPLETAFLDVTYNVSPKLPGSQNGIRRTLNVEILRQFARLGAERARFKYVIDWRDGVTCGKDFTQVLRQIEAARVPPSMVWLMPVAVTPDDLALGLAALAPFALRHGFNLSNRLHIQIYGDRRGV